MIFLRTAQSFRISWNAGESCVLMSLIGLRFLFLGFASALRGSQAPTGYLFSGKHEVSGIFRYAFVFSNVFNNLPSGTEHHFDTLHHENLKFFIGLSILCEKGTSIYEWTSIQTRHHSRLLLYHGCYMLHYTQ